MQYNYAIKCNYVKLMMNGFLIRVPRVRITEGAPANETGYRRSSVTRFFLSNEEEASYFLNFLGNAATRPSVSASARTIM